MAWKVIVVIQNAIETNLVCFLQPTNIIKSGKGYEGWMQLIKFAAAFKIFKYFNN